MILAKGRFSYLHFIYQNSGDLPDVIYGRRSRNDPIPSPMRDFAFASTRVMLREKSDEKIWIDEAED